jgi:hypothetical protein
LVTGVFASKNAVQFAAIAFAAGPPADAADDVAVLAGDELGAELAPLLPQAATHALTAQARRTRQNFLSPLMPVIPQPSL